MPHTSEKKQRSAMALFLVSLAITSAAAHANDWPNWRGPNHDGSTAESGLPAEWTTTKNVLWATEMPGSSSSTPIVSGDRVFVVSNDTDATALQALCLDRDTGAILWMNELVSDASANRRNDMASCSPVTDGKHIYFLFGSGDLIALDFQGAISWSRNLTEEFGPIHQSWGYSSSPLLYNGNLYIPILRGQWQPGVTNTDEASFMVAIDASTGETLWKVNRKSDAIGESFDSYATPIPYASGGKVAIVMQGGDYLTGHDPFTGAELWRQAHNPRHGRNDRLIPSPVVAGDLICGLQARGGNAFAVRPKSGASIAYEDSEWIYSGRTGDVPTPLYYDGRIYILNGVNKSLMCLDPATGEEIWKEYLGASARIWSSPTAGDGKIYCLDERGQVTVLAAGDKFSVISQSEMGGYPSKSSIAIADGKLFIRTAEKLYCVAAK